VANAYTVLKRSPVRREAVVGVVLDSRGIAGFVWLAVSVSVIIIVHKIKMNDGAGILSSPLHLVRTPGIS
jgi:hypothetical protein